MKRRLRTLVAILLLLALAYAAYSQRAILFEATAQVSAARLGLILLVMLPLFPIVVVAWHQLLLGVGGRLSYRQALGVWMLSNAARLIPGTVWQWLGRIYLAGTYGVPKLQAALSVAYEIALLMVSALVVGLGTLPFWPIPLELPWWVGATALVPLGFLWPTTLPKLVRLYGRIRRQPLDEVPSLSGRRILVALLANVANFLLSGTALWLLVGVFEPLPAFQIVSLAGMYALAWLLGYVTIVAPGGVGVADASLAGLVASSTSLAIGSVVALVYRVLLLVSELVTVGLAIALEPKVLADAKRKR